MLPSGRAAEKAPWGAYIYMAAANNLEPYAWVSLAQIAQTQPKQTPIIVAAHFKSRRGMYLLDLRNVSRDTLTAGKDHGPDYDRLLAEATLEVRPEHDFSRADTLREFLDWAGTRFPLERAAFVYWGHGYSWRGFAEDDRSSQPGHVLSFAEFRAALEEQQLEGRSFEWIGFDACSIGIIEIAYELRKLARYLVFSTYEVPFYGYPYDKILGPWLERQRGGRGLPGARAMVSDVVAQYGASYTGTAPAIPKGGALEAFKLVAVDTTKLEAQVAAFRKLAEELVAGDAGSTRWFRELQAQISSYDGVADIDALLFYLSRDLPRSRAWLDEARRELGYLGKPESLTHLVSVQGPNETLAHVSIKVAPGRYTDAEARRALTAINRTTPVPWIEAPTVEKGETSDELKFDIEIVNPDHRGRFRATFNPFVLGSREVDIEVEDAPGHLVAREPQHLHFERPNDLEFRARFPESSPIVAEAHGAEFPEFRSLGVLFTDQMADDTPGATTAYGQLEWEFATGWGRAVLEAGEKAQLRSPVTVTDTGNR